MTNPSSPGGQFPDYPQGMNSGQLPPPPPGYPAPARGTNVVAILALVFAFVFSPLGIVFGIIGRKQTKQRGESGRGLATAGLILGIVFTVLGVAFTALIIVAAANATPTLAQSKVETEISTQVVAKLGKTPDSVQCPGDLKGKVGTQITCTLTVSGVRGPVDVTVTSVNGRSVYFDIDVAKTGTPDVLQLFVESQISTQLAAKIGQKPDSVKCPGDLQGTVGNAITCTVTAAGESQDVEATVTSVEGLVVRFDITLK